MFKNKKQQKHGRIGVVIGNIEKLRKSIGGHGFEMGPWAWGTKYAKFESHVYK
jgi:hypothetical protein